jgi:hypothetical protein
MGDSIYTHVSRACTCFAGVLLQELTLHVGRRTQLALNSKRAEFAAAGRLCYRHATRTLAALWPKGNTSGLMGDSIYTHLSRACTCFAGFTAGADIACGQKDAAGAELQTCRICGGRAAVLSTCDANPRCVAFVMDGSSCGYLKGAKGPQQPGAYFWTFVKQ